MTGALKYLLAAAMMLAAGLAAGRATAASDAAAPVYAAFQKFCTATGARLDAIGAAVTAAGGTPKGPPIVAGHGAKQAKTVLWEFRQVGRAMEVMGIWATQPAIGRQPPVASEACSIVAWRDDASANAIQKWLGVPPYDVLGDALGTIRYFSFRDDGHTRSVMPSDPAAVAAIVARRQAWTLVLTQTPDAMTVLLQHGLAPPASPHRSAR